MRWKPLAALLGVILLAALAFSVWGPRAAAPAGSADATEAGLASPGAAGAATGLRAPPAPAAARPPPVVTAPANDGRPRAGALAPLPVAAPAPMPAVSPPTPPPAPEAHAAIDAGPTWTVDKDGIRSAIREKVPELRDCYEPWLLANPELQGRIKVSFTIDEDPDTGLGHVSEIGVLDGGMAHLAMQGCVMNVFKDLHFEPPQNGPVKVNYPLSFWAGDGGP